MASQLAASASNAGLNLSTANGSGNNQPNDLSSNQQLNEMQLAQQRFMMMMFLYNQFLQSQSQPTWAGRIAAIDDASTHTKKAKYLN